MSNTPLHTGGAGGRGDDSQRVPPHGHSTPTMVVCQVEHAQESDTSMALSQVAVGVVVGGAGVAVAAPERTAASHTEDRCRALLATTGTRTQLHARRTLRG
jgi:hypothetical protein